MTGTVVLGWLIFYNSDICLIRVDNMDNVPLRRAIRFLLNYTTR